MARKNKTYSDNQFKHFEAKTEQQGHYWIACQGKNLIAASGPSGVGKSFVAVAYAATMLKEHEIKKVVITRPAVENDDETYGYLKGDLDDKIKPYIAPVRDIFDDILGKSQTEAALHSGTIEVIPLGFMRGRTLDNCVIICDEAQNTTPKQMKTLLTRIGQYSKAIVQGDFTQKDIKGKSGLEVIIDYFEDAPYYQHVEFDKEDIVRSDLIGDILTRFENYESEK